MKHILRQLFHCEIDLDEERIPREKEYRTTREKIRREREYFKGILSQEDNKRLNELDDLRADVTVMECYANFACGFKLAVQLLLEACGGEELPEE